MFVCVNEGADELSSQAGVARPRACVRAVQCLGVDELESSGKQVAVIAVDVDHMALSLTSCL